jgi:hypothetical protein
MESRSCEKRNEKRSKEGIIEKRRFKEEEKKVLKEWEYCKAGGEDVKEE